MNFEAQLGGGAANAGVMKTAAAKGRLSKKRTENPPD
jgi:hypothetical protein